MSELIRREDAINAVEMFFKDAYIEDSDVHCTDMEYEINHIPAASPWHRVEDELPSEFQDVWAACKMNGRENWTIETIYYPYLSCPWGYHIPELKSGKAVVYAWMDRSAPEPPKEVLTDEYGRESKEWYKDGQQGI